VAARHAIRGRTLVTLSEEQRFNGKYISFDVSMIMYHLVIEKNVVKLKLNDCFKLNNKSFQITFKYYMICLKVCNNIF